MPVLLDGTRTTLPVAFEHIGGFESLDDESLYVYLRVPVPEREPWIRIVRKFAFIWGLSLVYLALTLAGLTKWLGGWYKSWYWREFSLPDELHGFSDAYFEHASWTTILTTTSCIVLASCLCLVFYAKGFVPLKRYRIGHSLLALFWILVLAALPFLLWLPWPVSFDPAASSFMQFVASKDYCLWFVAGVAAFVCAFRMVALRAKLYLYLSRHLRRVCIWLVIASLFLPALAWGYGTYVGHFVARYHGQAAIWEGKMNSRWARIPGETTWFIFVGRTDDGRNLLYDRERNVSRVYKGEVELDGPVTRARKNGQ